jgi:sterol desaturase/sphingolipid hydroxylase (fatty acid hydroxylase superfamily)
MSMAILLTILISYLVTTLFGHVVHWSLHQSWTGAVNRSHMTHHLKLYPPSDYLSDVYRQAGKDSTPKFFILAALPLIITPPILWAVGILPLSVMIIIMAMEGLMGFLHNYLHDAFHIRNHWLTSLPIFNYWVKMHYQHHVDMQANFGIFSFHWDRIFGSYRKIQ